MAREIALGTCQKTTCAMLTEDGCRCVIGGGRERPHGRSIAGREHAAVGEASAFTSEGSIVLENTYSPRPYARMDWVSYQCKGSRCFQSPVVNACER